MELTKSEAARLLSSRRKALTAEGHDGRWMAAPSQPVDAAREILEIDAALARIADGTYGTCEICGQPIEAERLAAMPEARTCTPCQARIERPGGRVEAA